MTNKKGNTDEESGRRIERMKKTEKRYGRRRETLRKDQEEEKEQY